MLKDFLEGKPLRHPLHPMLVHFPIGLFLLSLLLDLASLAFPSVPNLVRDSFYAMLLGVITALIAAVPGVVDYTDIRSDHPAKRTATTHLTLNLIVVALYGINLGENSDVIFVPIPEADRLGERETLRVEIDGQVITIAKIDQGFYAFQEFCTHRFGPLSEGTFKDFNVQCPWHNSCFDVRTGKVTQGPAKVDLKTFTIEIRDGKVAVGLPRAAATHDQKT